jgi:hypothetical protein
MLDFLKGKPTTVNEMLGKDDVRKLWTKFAEHELANCDGLILVKLSDHNVTVYGTTNVQNDAYAIGILEIAKTLIYKGGLCND